jgi:redox-sensitive bicupin YhaK (pirin superfamily)
MLWSEDIPTLELRDDEGKLARVTVVAGAFGTAKPLSPPPKSWASRKEADVAIWTLYLEPGAKLELPPAASADTVRTLYFFHGDAVSIGDQKLGPKTANVVRADATLPLVAGAEVCELLVLQGRPIDEPVVQHGPFVMNTRAEIEQAISDYRRTRFGGWPWPKDDPVHARDKGRFAKHADGKVEER